MSLLPGHDAAKVADSSLSFVSRTPRTLDMASGIERLLIGFKPTHDLYMPNLGVRFLLSV